MKKKILSGTALKYFAIIAMTIDHIAILFFSVGTLPYYVMRMLGRLTAPIMTYMLVEGFQRTRSRKKYFRRMMLFAAVAQPIYYLFVFGSNPQNVFAYFTHWNVLFTLAVALLVLMVLDNPKKPNAASMILLGVLICLAQFGDWSYLIPVWAMIFYYFKKNIRKMAILYVIACMMLQMLIYLKEFDSFADFSFQYGTLFALIPISMYNGMRGGEKHKLLNRWLFYIYYPMHMAMLIVVRMILHC